MQASRGAIWAELTARRRGCSSANTASSRSCMPRWDQGSLNMGCWRIAD